MRVGIVSPFSLTRESLVSLLNTDKSLQVTKVETLDGNLDPIRKMSLAVLLMETSTSFVDQRMISRLRELAPETKVLLLMDEVNEQAEYQALLSGARGCLSRASSPATLFKALRTVAQGELWVSHRAATRVLDERASLHSIGCDRSHELTEREFEILGLLAEGYTNKRLAAHLCVAENTIKTHLHSIFQKLAVQTRLDASLYYFRRFGRNGSSTGGDPSWRCATSENIGRSPRQYLKVGSRCLECMSVGVIAGEMTGMDIPRTFIAGHAETPEHRSPIWMIPAGGIRSFTNFS